ncbi:MAG: hypothetical protein ABSA68_18430 [Xanthobacteraceae bacterium]
MELVENDDFTAAQLVKLWPAHFTGSMAERCQHNPRMICDIAYGGRMGNARRRRTTATITAAAACRNAPARTATRSSPT